MATDPIFFTTPNCGAALLGAVETDLLQPTTASLIVSAGASGTKIDEIVVQAAKTASLVATTVAGLVYLWLYDSTTRTASGNSVNANATVSDTGAVAADVGRNVTGTSITAGTRIISVIAGTSFTMNQTASGANAVTVGPTYHLYDTVAVRAVTASASATPYHSLAADFASGTNRPPNLVLKTGWQLRASQSNASNASMLEVHVIGADA